MPINLPSKGFSLMVIIGLVFVIATGIYFVESRELPQGVAHSNEECHGPEVEGGPVCIPPHYIIDSDILDFDVIGDEKWREICSDVGGEPETAYVGGFAGHLELCIAN